MEAGPSSESTVRVHFGEHTAPSPSANIEFNLRLFSPQEQTVRNEIVAKINTQLPQTCIALQIPLHQAEPQAIASRLNQSKQVNVFNEKSPASVRFHASANSVYGIVESQKILGVCHEIAAYLEPVKTKAQEDSNHVTAKISSHNDLGRIAELIKEKGRVAWLDSLAAEFKFIKTEAVEQLVSVFIEKILGMPNQAAVVRAFRKINLELNCSSSHHLDDFAKYKVMQLASHPHSHLPSNDLVEILKDAGVANASIYLINEALFVDGVIQAHGLTALLTTLFA